MGELAFFHLKLRGRSGGEYVEYAAGKYLADTFFNCLQDRELVNRDRACLPDAVDTIDRLILRIWAGFKHESIRQQMLTSSAGFHEGSTRMT